MDTEIAARLVSHIDIRDVSQCWEWRNIKTGSYGQMSIGGRLYLGHRLMWEFCFGPIPSGVLVLHHCDNSRCCNPLHLHLGGKSENLHEAHDRGLAEHGERHYRSKITSEQASKIRSSKRRSVELAREHGISRQAVADIRSGRTWRRAGQYAPSS